MIIRVRILTIIAFLACVLLVGEKSYGLPSIPGVPSVPNPNQAAKGIVSNELLKQFGTWFNINRPVYVSGNDVLSTVATLPGGPFHPASQAFVQTLFQHAHNGILQLPAGDYNDFNALVAQFSHLGNVRPQDAIAATPWSVIHPGVYARLRTKGTLLTPGVVQIRVTAQAASRSNQVASTQVHGLGGAVAFDFGFPFTNWAGFFNGFTQPLSWTPEPGNAPDPGQSDGGPDGGKPNGWIYYGNSWHRSGGSGGSNPGSNNNNNNDDSGGGGSGGNQGGGTNGGNSSNDDNDDSSYPCDPPGNVFGVEKGALVSAGSTSMSIGRGKGHGVVCLLLRPFVTMAALGWPDRGTGQVDDGSVGYNLPGTSGSGNLVVLAHYTYATTSTINQIYVKKRVTAVIEYSDVSGLCPELSQALQLHPVVVQLGQPISNWLSGAELENRMCIAGMLGSAIQVHTWVVDGDTVNQFSLNHPVDPQNFLYQDAWNHM